MARHCNTAGPARRTLRAGDAVGAGPIDQLDPVARDRDDDLEAHAEAAGQVDAGFNAENHSLVQPLAVARDHERRLVALNAEAVAGAVEKVGTVTSMLDDVARRAIDLAAGDARAHRINGALLRLADRCVNLFNFRVGGPPDGA